MREEGEAGFEQAGSKQELSFLSAVLNAINMYIAVKVVYVRLLMLLNESL